MRFFHLRSVGAFTALAIVSHIALATQPTDIVVSDAYSNTASGTSALLNLQATGGTACASGVGNSAFGAYSLANTTTGASNTALGNFALGANTTGCFNN